jgi:hypothetical protein
LHIALSFVVAGGSHMHSTSSPVVVLAEPHEIISRLHPRSDALWITDAGIITLKPYEVNAILQGEFDVGMM